MTHPQRFGRFRIEARIGEGGMGTVFRAHDEKLDRTVALKLLADEDARDPEYMARLIREARLAATLDHPAIVFVHEVVAEDGVLGIAMEYLDGESLERCAKWSPPFEKRIAILETIAGALAHAHARGVIHRDVKPRNIIVPHEGHVPAKLVDFGVARPLSPQATKVTKEGVIVGTPRYMAPEQRETNAVDARADQYAWGVVAYELLGGAHPKDTKVDGRVTPLAWRCEQLGEARAAVIHRAMAAEPDARFASMNDLLLAWKGASAATRTIDVAKTPPPEPKGKPQEAKSGSARVFFIALAASIFVAGVFALGLWLGRSKPAPVATVPSASASPPREEPAPSIALVATVEAPPAIDAAPSAAPPKPHVPKISAQIDFFQNPAEANRRLHQAMPALIPCFAGKYVHPGAFAQIFMKIEPDGTVTQAESWSQQVCRGPKCVGAPSWLPEGAAKCAQKAFSPITKLPPLLADHTTGAWVEVDVIP